jgi:radical SAM protein with 4Fe4S-binding SPASM domain
MCPLKDSRYPKADMDAVLFTKIINDIKEWNPNRDSLTLYVFGEPFLYERIFDCFDYIQEKLKNCQIRISTNFSVVNEKIIERFFYPKAYNLSLGIWVDAFLPQTYAKQRAGGDYYKVLKNLDYLIALKKKYDTQQPEFHIGMVVTRNNRQELGRFLKFWKNKLKGLKGVGVRTTISSDFAGALSTDSVFLKKGKRLVFKNICLWPFQEMVIFSNGDVGLCCFDVNHNIIIGNAKDGNLKSIWLGPKAESFRKSMRSFALDSFKPCKDCHLYNMPVSELFRRPVAF